MKTPITVKKSGISWNTKYPNIAADTISKYRMGAMVEAGLYLRPYTTNKWEMVAVTPTAKSKINEFIDEVIKSKSHKKAVKKCSIPNGISDFLDFTFETIESNKPHIIASVFTFGREDLIPDMFINIVKTLTKKNETKIGDLLYYLERHIEMDGDEHGPMALQMISELCKDDENKWKEATMMSKKALEMRIKLWDYIESSLN